MSDANDFKRFCQLNPKPCPLLEVTEPGSHELQELASHVDPCTDLPQYRAFRKGRLVEEPTSIIEWRRDDLVSFLLGYSYSFEQAMMQAGLPLRHIEEQKNVPVYRTNIACKPAGTFHGHTIASMRPIPSTSVQKAIQVTSRYPFAHGEPLHGVPERLYFLRH